MDERTLKKISLPLDTNPHRFSNIEWWYFFAFITGEHGGRYAVMASFFRVGETELNKGHYLIFNLIDLNEQKQENFSLIDTNLKLNMIAVYLPLYLIFNPKDSEMWHLYKNLLIGKIPKPHDEMNSAVILKNPAILQFGNNSLSFFGENEECFHAKLQHNDRKIDLTFKPIKPVAIVGEDGKPDHLYYYSFTRNSVNGKIQTNNGIEHVTGEGWFDHQWGRDYKILKGNGWNWFGLQLDDGRELLINGMYSSKAKIDSLPMANLIDIDGETSFTRKVTFYPQKYWKSLRSNAKYPVQWKIIIPEFAMELNISVPFPKQEMPIIGPMQAIWEGVCTVSGYEITANSKRKKLAGKGFMELVGYASF